IDLTRCKTDTACFVRGSCLKVPEPSEKLVAIPSADSLSKAGFSCDVIVQIKAFSEYKLQFMLQVNSSELNLIPSMGIELHQKDLQFACYPPDQLVKRAPSLTIESFGERQLFMNN
ncbi:hypothetical protein PFISCL1PPCAC_995, partial [Pristionchus fissidentatus]